ncbi:uncharacterized protein LOC117046229 [Lacerta agilis]|uniref:uncharacterized protein LOC117046229 n=1 Tax=Lacerta agilis TaxID=80427 RepID=UPI0014196B03|nr:uncharacterized protein LOC117046229 [Lacerta agilis]
MAADTRLESFGIRGWAGRESFPPPPGGRAGRLSAAEEVGRGAGGEAPWQERRIQCAQVTLRAAVASDRGKVREGESKLLQLEEAMAQMGQNSRHFLLSSHNNVNAAPEWNSHNRSVDIAEQMEMNIRAATQVGHQLAMIGDECNRMYTGKLEDSLLHLAKGIAANVFHACIWSNFRSIMKAFGSFLNSGWRKKILDCNWILWLPLNCVCQKWWPAALLAILMWGLVTYGLQD